MINLQLNDSQLVMTGFIAIFYLLNVESLQKATYGMPIEIIDWNRNGEMKTDRKTSRSRKIVKRKKLNF